MSNNPGKEENKKSEEEEKKIEKEKDEKSAVDLKVVEEVAEELKGKVKEGAKKFQERIKKFAKDVKNNSGIEDEMKSMATEMSDGVVKNLMTQLENVVEKTNEVSKKARETIKKEVKSVAEGEIRQMMIDQGIDNEGLINKVVGETMENIDRNLDAKMNEIEAQVKAKAKELKRSDSVTSSIGSVYSMKRSEQSLQSVLSLKESGSQLFFDAPKPNRIVCFLCKAERTSLDYE